MRAYLPGLWLQHAFDMHQRRSINRSAHVYAKRVLHELEQLCNQLSKALPVIPRLPSNNVLLSASRCSHKLRSYLAVVLLRG